MRFLVSYSGSPADSTIEKLFDWAAAEGLIDNVILKQFVTLLAKDKNVSVLDSVSFLHGKQLLQKFTRVSLRYKIKTKLNKKETKKPYRLGLQTYETKNFIK